MTIPKIDVHHHILPPAFKKAWDENPAESQGMRLPPWSPEQSLAFMEKYNIKSSILSLGAPATSMGSDSAARAAFCREMNEYSSGLCAQYPKKFGFFATVPSLHDTQECIGEIKYALEELHADGINMLTSYGGKYLGHPDFTPVWDELDRHAAVCFLHPGLETAGAPIMEPGVLPKPIFDWTHETTRTAAHLITTDMLKTHPACRVILPHGGGTFPYIVNRIAHLSEGFNLMNKTAEEFIEEAKGFYYDLAFAGYEEPLGLLLNFAKPGHVLYGTDYPFGRDNMVATQVEQIDNVLKSRSDAALICQDAALQLWPRFAD
ncbi:Decarboxylase [Lachnellula occidentalis]|uniref:6-methylsalicylate decarboxylase n=1 Tax=Lachnellula occidentalis TaxID=215460 RepID=A0A8H8RTB6_9HELO|nr:Decarboxylase [Lachnellula occidentalis]